MDMTAEQLFKRISMAAPGFAVVVNEHLRDNGELLAHVLMADLLRYIGSYFTRSSTIGAEPPTAAEVRTMLQVLDAAMDNANSATENAIAVSFVEGIEGEPFFSRLAPLLGPRLRAELERQKAWRPAAR